MPIVGKSQVVTTEDKLEYILKILSKLSIHDAGFIKEFVLDICKRYCDKVDEFNTLNPSPSLLKMNNFELEYIKRIINDLNL